jgi:23S rRNA pseudoU1915 N3-methylase RlmH
MDEHKEYEVCHQSPEYLAAELNRLGQDGWRPVTIAIDGRDGWVIAIVERAVRQL